MDKQEIAQIVEDFLNENGLWWTFKEYIEKEGYKISELGFSEEDD